MAGKGIPELLNYKQKGKDLNEFIKVPLSEKLAYCFGDPALTLMYTMTTTLLIYFYTNVVGISAGAVGMIMLLSRVFDGFSDVLMGTIIDRTHSQIWKGKDLDFKACGSLCAGSGAFVHYAANGKYGKDHLCFCYL